jgi:hypothetical protein
MAQGNGKMKITKRQLTYIVKEELELGSEAEMARDIATEVIEDTLNNLYHEEGFENQDLRDLLLQILKNLDAGFIGEPS